MDENLKNIGKIDNLHIPHIGFLQWYCPSDKADAIRNSIDDKSQRKFGVLFFLEDLHAGTKYTHIKFDGELSQRIKDNANEINMWFRKNNEGYLNAILAELNSDNHITAFKMTSKFIFGILSALSFFYRRPFRIAHVKIMDAKNKAEVETRKFCSKPAKLVLPKASFQPADSIGSLFAIYREGMNSVDIAYRYICFFKIYEAWCKRVEKFFAKKEETREKIIITADLLKSFYNENFHRNFLEKSFDDKDVYEILNHIRKHLVHPVIDRNDPASFCNLDHMDFLEHLEMMSNLIERMVTKILDVELAAIAKTDSNIAELLNTYKINET